MIISHKHRFAFVHIPKCAGTSVRMQLKAFDETNGCFDQRVGEHPALGTLDYTHIPLRRLRTFFPEEFRVLSAYESFALVRDPVERFRSALSQRLRMYKRLPISQLSDREVIEEVDNVIRFLEKGVCINDHKYIHFERQANFIELDDCRVVRRLFTIDNINELLEVIGELVGRELEPPKHVNPSLVYRSPLVGRWATGVPREVRRFIGSLLGDRLKARVRSQIYRSPQKSEFEAVIGQGRCAFIRAYYERDFEIYGDTLGE